MPTITEERRRQIEQIQEEIEAEVKWISLKKEEMQQMLDLMQGVSESSMAQMSRSASGSNQRRRGEETVDIRDRVKAYESLVESIEQAIEIKEKRIEDLEEEKRALEEFDSTC